VLAARLLVETLLLLLLLLLLQLMLLPLLQEAHATDPRCCR
jgi:hypothetical protein